MLHLFRTCSLLLIIDDIGSVKKYIINEILLENFQNYLSDLESTYDNTKSDEEFNTLFFKLIECMRDGCMVNGLYIL